MKIAVLGTRGIPNNYGGFEQFAELASQIFVKNNHEVVVYNPSDHPYASDTFHGIKIVRMTSRERSLGFLNTFLFDYLCFRDADSKDFDVVLFLGYHPVSLYYKFKKNRAKIVTNMAGMEWQRSKWNAIAKWVIKYCEKLAVLYSDAIVADNEGIANYYRNTYRVHASLIAYGAVLPGQASPSHLDKYGVKKNGYSMLIARFQPDNNIEMVLDGYCSSMSNEPFLVVGNCSNKYGQILRKKYKNNPNIRFTGPVYDYQQLSSLRHFARLYFHGHSCGGTNPSLLEAMASGALVASHDNEFNRAVLGTDAFYFNTAGQVAEHIRQASQSMREIWSKNNKDKILTIYSWDIVASEYIALFERVLGSEEKLQNAGG
jgi:glycosyltransferase involved in cell wall biosynthesis